MSSPIPLAFPDPVCYLPAAGYGSPIASHGLRWGPGVPAVVRMKFFVGVTDNEWFRFLSGLDAPEEGNFWQPRGPRPFRALAPGDLWHADSVFQA